MLRRLYLYNQDLTGFQPIGEGIYWIGRNRTTCGENRTTFSQDVDFEPSRQMFCTLLSGSSDLHSSDVLLTALHPVRKDCSLSQKLHIHCFTGCKEDVEEWLQEFPNCRPAGGLENCYGRPDSNRNRFSIYASQQGIKGQHTSMYWRCSSGSC